MASKTAFVCTSCGFESGKWYGRCPSCNSWNTFDEFKVEDKKKNKFARTIEREEKVFKLSEVVSTQKVRQTTHFDEFDRVLGGGFVSGEVVLLSGDPGIGKSTLLLQVGLHISSERVVLSETKDPIQQQDQDSKSGKKKVLYITGEESEDQVKIRAERIMTEKALEKTAFFILSTSNIDSVIDLIKDTKPDFVIVDSIQTMQSSEVAGFPGSIPQIRYCTTSLVSLAKALKIPVILVGHVTKEGIAAGPMLLSHMVDAVLYLEGERFSGTRILRAFKNRFGDVAEVGIFMMEEKGLVEIADASSFFLNSKNGLSPGSCACVIVEGSRPILVEFQGLVVPSSLAFPRRVVNGVSDKRVELLLAVIQKHCKLPLERFDVFVNVVGGLKVLETASDLAICMAVISSFKNKSLNGICAVSEVGLLGELRPVVQLDKREKEARKFGYSQIVTPKSFTSITNVVQSIV